MLDLEQMSEFGKGLDFRQASEEAFDVKAVYNSTLDSEALKQTLFRQAKNQVGSILSFAARLAKFPRGPQSVEILETPPLILARNSNFHLG